MANKEAIIAKLVRNATQRGYTASISGTTALFTKTGGDVLTVSYTDKSVQSPMGGVSAASAPYLGIGVAAPGTIKIKGAAAETTIAGIFDTVEALALLSDAVGFGNDVVIERGDNTTELARIRPNVDNLGLGQ